MKKIKLSFKSKKLNTKPSIALLIHAEQRHKLTALMVDWYQEIRQQLQEQIDLSICISSVRDFEYKDYCEQQDLELITVQPAARGEVLNQGLYALKDKGHHGVINLWAGDFLSATLIQSYANHLANGGFFAGLLDQYLFDPNEFKCMYWPKAEFAQGLERVCSIGYLISTQLLDALQWKLWPLQNELKSGSLQLQGLQRLEKLFKRCPKNSCLLKTMNKYEGAAVSLKSELGRVLFDEKNWQNYPGLQFADFESSFENHTSQTWLDRLSDFDERLYLDILIEQSDDDSLWRSHYDFCIYKFLPYAEVRLHLITQEESEPQGTWTHHHSTESSLGQRWNKALTTIKESASDLVLFGGKGGLIDLKTIEHYLIYIFKKGARLLCIQNFFMADSDSRDIYFWSGVKEANFDNTFGFGTCVHRSYLNQIGWTPFDDHLELNQDSHHNLKTLLADRSQKHRRVFFQCAAHKLGILAFDPQGSMNCESKINTADLQKVNFTNYLPDPCYNNEIKNSLSRWTGSLEERERYFEDLPQNKKDHTTASKYLTSHHSTSSDHSIVQSNVSTMSPLERAKALLKQSASDTNQSESSTHETTSTATLSSMSPLERAKALLQEPDLASNKINASTSAESETTTITQEPKSMSSNMSPLERAKALLKQSQSAQTPTPSKVQDVVQNNQDSSENTSVSLSPLERAKALLKSTNDTVKTVVPAVDTPALSPLEKAKALLKATHDSHTDHQVKDEEEQKQESKTIIQHTLQAAEELVNQLKDVKEAALQQVQADMTQVETHKAQVQAGDVLCQQGEDTFVAGQINTARTLFESALVVQKDSVRAMNNLGVLALQEATPGSEWKALSYFLLAMIHDAQNQDVVQNLSDLFQMYPHLKAMQNIIFDG